MRERFTPFFVLQEEERFCTPSLSCQRRGTPQEIASPTGAESPAAAKGRPRAERFPRRRGGLLAATSAPRPADAIPPESQTLRQFDPAPQSPAVMQAGASTPLRTGDAESSVPYELQALSSRGRDYIQRAVSGGSTADLTGCTSRALLQEVHNLHRRRKRLCRCRRKRVSLVTFFDKPKKVTRAFVTLTSDPLRLPDGSHLPLVTKGRLWGRRRRCAALRRGAFGRDILFRHSTHYY